MQIRLCTFCEKQILRKVHPKTKQPFCDSTCYSAWQRGKSFLEQEKPLREKRECSMAGCDEIHFGRGYCRKHYISEFYSHKNNPEQSKQKKARREDRICIHCGKKFCPPLESSKYCSSKCSGGHKRQRFILKKGYKKILMATHPRADGKGYVFEHILIAEKVIGRTLAESEEVHHKDLDKLNNDPSNLVICASHSEHMAFHRPSPRE